jgi:hypothetical protein
MPAILTVVVLGAVLAFLLFVLVGFWREATSFGPPGEHLRVTPFCMSGAQGWPHANRVAAEDRSAARSRKAVLQMPALRETQVQIAHRGEAREFFVAKF